MPSSRTIPIALLALLTAGCTLVHLRSDTRAYDGDAILVGRVSGPPGWQGPVRVVAVARQGGEAHLAHQVLLHEPGGFELIVPAGRYLLTGRPSSPASTASATRPGSSSTRPARRWSRCRTCCTGS